MHGQGGASAWHHGVYITPYGCSIFFFFFFLPYSTLCFFVVFFFGLVWVGLGFAIEPVCHAGTLTVCSHTSPEGLAEVFRVQQLPLITIQGGLSQELHSSLASDKPLLQAVFRLFFSSKG